MNRSTPQKQTGNCIHPEAGWRRARLIVPIRLVTAPERHSNQGRFGLAELIDFEVQLASDRDRPREELIARDRAIALRWQNHPKSATELVTRWLASLPRSKRGFDGWRTRRAGTRHRELAGLCGVRSDRGHHCARSPAIHG